VSYIIHISRSFLRLALPGFVTETQGKYDENVQASRKLGITEVDLSRAEAGLEAAEA